MPSRELKYGWLSRLALVLHSRSADLAVHARDGTAGAARADCSTAADGGCTGFRYAWSWLIMKTIFSPVKVTGLDKIDTSKPHVYAVNHASALDIPVLYVDLAVSVPHRVQERAAVVSGRGLAAEAVGTSLHRSAESVALDRSIRAAVKGLKAGMPLVIFPRAGARRTARSSRFCREHSFWRSRRRWILFR